MLKLWCLCVDTSDIDDGLCLEIPVIYCRSVTEVKYVKVVSITEVKNIKVVFVDSSDTDKYHWGKRNKFKVVMLTFEWNCRSISELRIIICKVVIVLTGYWFRCRSVTGGVTGVNFVKVDKGVLCWLGTGSNS